MTSTIGERIRDFRKSQRLSQAALGKELGFSQGMVGFIESDEKLPSTRFVEAFCSRFGVNPNWVLNGTEPRDAPQKPLVEGQANNLAFYRAMRGYTQSDLSARTDVSVNQIEAAEIGDPSVTMEVFQKCAQALDVTLAQIFDEPRRNVEKHLAKALGDVPLERLIEIARNVKSDLGSK
ncbi:MAG: helix-turn-helix domain-containing protein [Paracoccaceae bacterium]